MTLNPHNAHGAGSLLLLADGMRCNIDTFTGGTLVVYNAETLAFETFEAGAAVSRGFAPTLRLTMATGRTCTVAHTHPLRLLTRAVAASQLQKGQRIAAIRSYRQHVPQGAVSLTQAHKLGYDLAMLGLTDSGIHVPEGAYRCQMADLRAFLQGMFSTAAHVYGATLTLRSKSVQLLQDVAHLALRLGILTTLESAPDEPDHPHQLTFLGDCIRRLQLNCQQRHGGTASGPMPLRSLKIDAFGPEIRRLLPAQGAVWRDIERDKLHELAKSLSSTRLQDLLQAPVMWDRIVAIEDGGGQPTFTLQVPRMYGYICNDIVHYAQPTDA